MQLHKTIGIGSIVFLFCATPIFASVGSVNPVIPNYTIPTSTQPNYNQTFTFPISYQLSVGNDSYGIVNVGNTSSGSPFPEINAGQGTYFIPLTGGDTNYSFTVPFTGVYILTGNVLLINDSQWGVCPGEWINAYFRFLYNGAPGTVHLVPLPGGGADCISDQPTFGSFSETVTLTAGTVVSIQTWGWSNAPGTTDAYYVSVGTINVIGPAK